MFMLTLALFVFFCFFFNAPPTTAIYTLSLHDALPICNYGTRNASYPEFALVAWAAKRLRRPVKWTCRSEEHTSELQSHSDLVCRLLLEKKKSEPRAQARKRTSSQPHLQRRLNWPVRST